VKMSLPGEIIMKAAGIPLFKKEGNYLRGIFQAMRGDTDKALDSFRAYGAEGGETPELAAGRAITLISARRHEEALAELDRALAQQPSGMIRLLRGQALLNLGAAQEALADIQAAGQDGGLVPGVKGMLGAAYLEFGGLDEAIVALQEAGTEMTATSGTFFALADAYRLSGRDAEARDAYEEAAARAIVDVQYAVAADRGILPLALARLGKLDEAASVVQEALATSTNDPSVYIARALIEVRRGTPSFAASDLEQALAISAHAAVKALEDPDFAPVSSSPEYQALLERAKAERERVLERVRNRRQPAQQADYAG
ncbi:MAG: tetratricopeptide repeat protein, partial [Burkholderiales bacterium]